MPKNRGAIFGHQVPHEFNDRDPHLEEIRVSVDLKVSFS